MSDNFKNLSDKEIALELTKLCVQKAQDNKTITNYKEEVAKAYKELLETVKNPENSGQATDKQ